MSSVYAAEKHVDRAGTAMRSSGRGEGKHFGATSQPAVEGPFQHRTVSSRAQTLAVNDPYAATVVTAAPLQEVAHGESGITSIETVQVKFVTDVELAALEPTKDRLGKTLRAIFENVAGSDQDVVGDGFKTFPQRIGFIGLALARTCVQGLGRWSFTDRRMRHDIAHGIAEGGEVIVAVAVCRRSGSGLVAHGSRYNQRLKSVPQ